MKVQNNILLIMSCKKYKSKAQKQIDGWLSKLSNKIIYFHVLGDVNLNKDFMFDYKNKKLYIKVEDDYNSLPKKVIRAYLAILNTFDFKYIFKTDDDQMINDVKILEIIINVLDKSNPKKHYGGNLVEVPIPYLSEYYRIHPELPKNLIIQKTSYCNGRFYFLSRESIEILSYKQLLIENEYLEDYAIGLNLPSFLKNNLLNLTTEKFFFDQP